MAAWPGWKGQVERGVGRSSTCDEERNDVLCGLEGTAGWVLRGLFVGRDGGKGGGSYRGTGWGWTAGGEGKGDMEVDLMGWIREVGICIYMASVSLLQVGPHFSLLSIFLTQAPA